MVELIATMLRRGLQSRVIASCVPSEIRRYSSCNKNKLLKPVQGSLANKNVAFGLRRLSKSVEETIQHEKVSSAKDQLRALELLSKATNKRIPAGILDQKVQEILLEFLARDNVPADRSLALDLLRIALDHAQRPTLIPRLFSLTSQIIVRSGHPSAARDVYHLLWTLLENKSQYFTDDLSVNSQRVNDCFCQLINPIVLDSNKRKRKIDYEVKAQLELVIRRMKHLWEDPSIPLVANAEACNSLILYLCNQQKPKEAFDLLKWMVVVATSKKSPIPLKPRVSSFTILISTYGKMGEPEKASEILHWMLENKNDDTIPSPNWSCFNGLLDAWAKSGREDAGKRAEEILEWMQQLHDTQGMDTKPDEVSFNICTNAWAQTPGTQSPANAEAVLRRMIELNESGSIVGPKEHAFTSVMNAWANSQRPDAPNRVESLLKLMESLSKKTNNFSMTSVPYTILIKAWGHLARRSSGNMKQICGDKALEVLKLMENASVTPTAGTYNAIIIALLDVRSINGLLYFLMHEEDFRQGKVPMDTRTFNCGLNAIATANMPDGAEQAMAVLDRMIQYAQSDSRVRPDETTFNIILKVLSRSRSEEAAAKAHQLLLEMNEMPNIKPTDVSYLTCIIAWGRSQDKDKFDRIRKLLLHLDDNYRKSRLSGRPTVFPYNAALSACYHNTIPELNSDALRTALDTMTKLRKLSHLRPNHTTYLSLFKAVELLAEGNKRDSLLAQEFEHCIKDSLVSRQIVKILHGASISIFHRYFGDENNLTNARIPEDWVKNHDERTGESFNTGRVRLR